ncbi:MAG: hypothetical protein ACFE0I_05320 [Elainellaceae cyanobacterium]
MSFKANGQLKCAVTAIWDSATEWHVSSTDASIATDLLAHPHSLQQAPRIDFLRLGHSGHSQKIGATASRFLRLKKIRIDDHDNVKGDRCVSILGADSVCNLRNLSNYSPKLVQKYGDRIVLKLLEGDISDNNFKFRGLVFKSEVLRYLYVISGSGRLFAARLLSVISNASEISRQQSAFDNGSGQCDGFNFVFS